MGLFSSIAGFFGNKKLAKASKKAATAQVDALGQGINTVQTQQTANDAALQQALGGLAPYTQAGASATTNQADLLGLNGPDAQMRALGAVESSPLLQRILGAGTDLRLANASAIGGVRGGNIKRELADFGADTYASLVQQQLQQLGELSTRGLSAVGTGLQGTLTGAQLGSDNADTIASLLSGQGSARAGGILGKAKYNAAALGNLASAAGSVASAFLPTGGLGGTIRGLI